MNLPRGKLVVNWQIADWQTICRQVKGGMTTNDHGEAAAAFYDKRRKWADYVAGRREVTHAAFRVGYWLCRKMNGKDQCCWYSVGEVARQMQVSTKTVTEATRQLETLGLMIVVRRPGRGNTYHIRLPFE